MYVINTNYLLHSRNQNVVNEQESYAMSNKFSFENLFTNHFLMTEHLIFDEVCLMDQINFILGYMNVVNPNIQFF